MLFRSPFDGKYVICYLSTAGGLKGPKKNADYINALFLPYQFIAPALPKIEGL